MKAKIKKMISNAGFVFIVVLIMTCTAILNSCIYNDTDLFTTLDEENIDDNQDSPVEELDVNSKEFFLKSKEKQMNKNLLTDINIRKAIFYAIDRQKIVEELFGKYNQVHNSIFPEYSYYYYQSWNEYDYNIDKAEEYLNMAGYSINNPLYITIGSISDSETKQTIEEIIKEDLNRIGIKLWIFNKSSEEWYMDCVGKGDYELGLWSIYNFDGSSLGYSFSSDKIPSMTTEENKYCENFYWYSNTDVDEIIKSINSEEDIDLKKVLFKKLQSILADDAVILPLYERMFYIVYNNEKLQNIDMDIKNNKAFFDLGNWILSNNIEVEDKEENEIAIGFEGEDYELENLFKNDYISDLLLKCLWEINEYGEYENILVEEYGLEYNTSGSSEEKVKVVLKDKILWEDGKPITSEDVKYTFDFIKENGNISGINGDLSKVDGIEIIDENEFYINFGDSIKDWKNIFSFVLMPEGLLDGKSIDDCSIKDIVANGPYKVEQYVTDEFLLLKKNNIYFEDVPDIDYFKIIFDTDINNLIGLLRDKEIDLLIVPFDINLIESFNEDESFNVLIKPGNMFEHLAVCLKSKEE
jgi:ABC-type transport system substrate-binding protein